MVAAVAKVAQWMKEVAAVVAAVEQMKEMKEAAAVVAAAGTSAADRRRVFVDIAGSRPSCVRSCNHFGCTRLVISNGAEGMA